MAKISENLLLNLRMTRNSQKSMAARCEVEYRTWIGKLRSAMARSEDEQIIRMYAEQAIRQRSSKVVFTRMAAQVDIIYKSALMARQQRQVSDNLVRTARIMAAMSKQLTPEKMMAACESLQSTTETMEVVNKVFDQAFTTITSSTTPENQVVDLIKQVCDENNISVRQRFPNATNGSLMASVRDSADTQSQAPSQEAVLLSSSSTTPPMSNLVPDNKPAHNNDVVPENDDDDLERRLANLKK